jgi:hypothetical protein
MKRGLSWFAFSLAVLGADALVDSRALPIEGDAPKASSSRSKIFSSKKEEFRKADRCFSVISTSESDGEGEPLPSPKSRKKVFREFWQKHKPWGRKEKTRSRSEAYSSSGEETGYETDEGEPYSPISLEEVKFSLPEEPGETKSPLTVVPEESPKISVATRKLSARREDLISPLTLKILDRGDAENALKNILRQKSDEYDAKGRSFTRELKEFEEIVDHFILENPALSFMTEEERQGFIKVNARSSSGASPLKPTRRTMNF